MTHQSTLNCSSTMVDILLEGVREMIGSSATILNSNTKADTTAYENAILLDKFDRDSITEPDLLELFNFAPEVFGDRGTSGIALRIGEASFRHFLRRKGEEYSLCGNSYRLMNSKQRTFFGLSKLAEFADQNCDADIKIEEENDYWIWDVDIHKSNFLITQFFKSYTIGLLREFFSWSSGGRYFPIEAKNMATTFQIRINKQPLGN